MNFKRFIYLSGLAGFLTMILLGGVVFIAAAQQVGTSPQAIIYPSLQYQVPPAQVRTWQEMEAAAVPKYAAPIPQPREIPFRTPLGIAAYKELKAQAAQSSGQPAPLGPQAESAVPRAATPITNLLLLD